MQELNLNLDNILEKDKQLSFKTFFLAYHLKKDTEKGKITTGHILQKIAESTIVEQVGEWRLKQKQ